MEFITVYESLLRRPAQAFVQTKAGEIIQFKNWLPAKSSFPFHILPDSFEQLSPEHKYIFSCMPQMKIWPHGHYGISMHDMEGIGIHELSLTHNLDSALITKKLSFQEMKERLSHFIGYSDTLITNVASFQEKTGLLHALRAECTSRHTKNIFFHVEIETINRLMAQFDALAIQALACEFVVYPQDGYNGPIPHLLSNMKFSRGRSKMQKITSTVTVEVTEKSTPKTLRDQDSSVGAGFEALERGLKVLTTPGVKLALPQTVARYHIDPEDSKKIIRTTRSGSKRGTLKNGKFIAE